MRVAQQLAAAQARRGVCSRSMAPLARQRACAAPRRSEGGVWLGAKHLASAMAAHRNRRKLQYQ